MCLFPRATSTEDKDFPLHISEEAKGCHTRLSAVSEVMIWSVKLAVALQLPAFSELPVSMFILLSVLNKSSQKIDELSCGSSLFYVF